MTQSAPETKQYIVLLPKDAGEVQLPVDQSQLEKNLSSATRKVVTLSVAQVEELKRKIAGVQIIENEPVFSF